MYNFIQNLKKLKNNKYKNTFSSIFFLKKRNDVLVEILKFKNKDVLLSDKIFFKKIFYKKKINTEALIKSKKFIPEQKFNKLYIFLYKHFNYSLKLKKSYQKKMKKNKSREVDFLTYLLFGNYLIDQMRIDELQKLNTICKINDITILKFKKKNHYKLLKLIKKNIKYEFKLKKKYAKKFISHTSKY